MTRGISHGVPLESIAQLVYIILIFNLSYASNTKEIGEKKMRESLRQDEPSLMNQN